MLTVKNLNETNPLSKNSSHSFDMELTNAGDTNITITSVSPTCSCSVVDLTHSILKPGEVMHVPVNISLIGSVGNMYKGVDVRYLYKQQEYAINWSVQFIQI